VSLLSHSCVSNLRHAVNPGGVVALIAQTDIRHGQELTIRYTHLMQGHIK
jgi:SET domain-containing protein